MPQMGPLNWFMLMIYFSMLMVMYNTFIYSMFYYTIKNHNKNKIEMNWKW